MPPLPKVASFTSEIWLERDMHESIPKRVNFSFINHLCVAVNIQIFYETENPGRWPGVLKINSLKQNHIHLFIGLLYFNQIVFG